MEDANKNPIEALAFALEKYPERLMTLPVEEILMESARQNAKRPAYLKVAVPDDVAKAMRGPASRNRDLLLLVSIPKEILERSESAIILPNEV